ncbi:MULTISPECIES: extracellular solute-binding protein [Pontibacter]|uniref:Extracellular solute-binding protein n=2 Tax=Pontibacter TaxID=323449 RepID=A0A5C8KBK4_9BACT|nr:MULTISPECIES: extracellular solute-binding protein [Pontibacter]PVY38338.1 iron(III) transport system substrate-binding protein [Pontibacter virosus]QCR25274.1 iron ABC transporter substrate-binding protein [Pontibacter sp. SGAir0037]TXK50038.1 extracellular solute-binding protein [Pontibacter qinzhouensis]
MKEKLYKILALLLVTLSTGCGGGNEGEVVVYTSVDQVFAEPILHDFERETGIKVKAVFDTEETKSTGVLNRLIAEANNPQCDLFWSGDPVRANVLKQKGISQPFSPEAAQTIPGHFIDEEKHWTGFSSRARVLIYNKDLLPANQVPTSIFDLTKEEYRGKVTVANPLFGTTSFHMAAIFAALGDEQAKKWLDDLKANNVVIATSNGDVKKRVANGEVWLGLTDTDDANEAMKEGAPIGVVFLGQQDIGTLIIPNTLSLIKGSPNPEEAQRLANYLMSEETQLKLAHSSAQMPLSKGVEVPEGVFSLDKVKPMRVDYDKSSKKLEEIQPYLKEWVETNM